MTKKQWNTFFPFFTPGECGLGMDEAFMLKVLMFRKALDIPMIVICGYETSGHAPNSYHYVGRALDFWCKQNPRKTMRLIDRLGLFGGVGFYPWGAHKSFHIDDRDESPEKYQRWISPKKGKYIYLLPF